MPPKKSDSDLQSSTLTAPTSSAAGEQGVVAQDLFYDNPKADLIILSSDGVIFRVDAWTFAKKSQFVKDLLGVPSKEPLALASIPVTFNRDVVRYFIDLVMTRSGTYLSIDLEIEYFNELFQLCDAPSVCSSILQVLLIRITAKVYPAGLDAWEVFKIAAKHDCKSLAIEAVKNFEKCGYTHDLIFNDVPERFIFADIPQKYAMALYRSGFEVTQGGQTYNNSTGKYERSSHWTVRAVGSMGDHFMLEQSAKGGRLGRNRNGSP